MHYGVVSCFHTASAECVISVPALHLYCAVQVSELFNCLEVFSVNVH